MSNPFATFRKNKNYWMAALVLLAILAFVVAPAIDQASQAFRGGDAGNAVVVRWDGGKMTVSDLQIAMQRHGSLVRFLSAVAREVIEAGGEPKVPGFFYDPQSQQIMGLGIQSNSDEESICNTRILADKAKQLGVEFTDDAIDDFILAYCDNKISTSRLAQILQDAGGGRLTNFDVRELLKQELAALVVRRTASTAVYSHPPGEIFQNFLKLNQAAVVEAFPMFVDERVSEVKGMPTEAEIQAIYDLGSTQFANPNSPLPGFVQPYQANFEFIQSSIQERAEFEKARLTEEQLRAEYQRLVELEQLQVPVESPEAADAAVDAPESGDGPSNDSPREDALELSPPAGDGPVDSEGTESSSLARTRQVQFVALQQAGQTDEQDELPPSVVQPAQLGGGEGADAVDNPLRNNAQVSEDQPVMRTQTFEEARDSIASSLAQTAAIQGLDNALTRIYQDIMRPYQAAYRQYVAYRDAESQLGLDKFEMPPEPDLKKLAEEEGLTYGQTGLVDGFKLSQSQFGMSQIRRDDEANPGFSGAVASAGLSPELRLFQPLQSSYFDQSVFQQGRMPEFFQYLFWKSEDRPVKVPELSEIRAEVVDFWKRQQARQLTESAASALAKKVVGQGENPWQNALSTAEQSLVVQTDPFTWMTRMGEFNMPSNVPKLDAVGGEFMRNVFSAKEGQVVVAANQNQSTYYVVRVTSFLPAAEELRQRFIADPVRQGPREIAQEESNRMVQGWYEHLYSEMNVQWQMSLDQL